MTYKRLSVLLHDFLSNTQFVFTTRQENQQQKEEIVKSHETNFREIIYFLFSPLLLKNYPSLNFRTNYKIYVDTCDYLSMNKKSLTHVYVIKQRS